MSGIYLGLDCGGSSSRAVALNDEGQIVHQAQSGSANLASTPTFRLRQNLAHAMRGCPTPDAICACFAGLLTEEDRIRALELLHEVFPGVNTRAEPDYTAAFFACAEGVDLCVISGTGSLVCSEQGGKMAKSGGRGYILGDEGSAFQYGRDALLAYFANPEGASPPLKKCIVDVFDVEDEPSIVSRLYRSPSPQAALAKLAKPLASDARAGVEYAVTSIDRHSRALARVVLGHASAFMPWKKKLEVCLSGGLWKTSIVFVEGLERALGGSDLEIHLERIKTPPVFGAVRLAKEMASGH